MVFPHQGERGPHINTMRRWVTRGCNGVRLQAVKVGNQWLTTADWVSEFVAACTRKAQTPTAMELKQERSDAHGRAIESLRRSLRSEPGSQEAKVSHLFKSGKVTGALHRM